jgi:hypothetical protein
MWLLVAASFNMDISNAAFISMQRPLVVLTKTIVPISEQNHSKGTPAFPDYTSTDTIELDVSVIFASNGDYKLVTANVGLIQWLAGGNFAAGPNLTPEYVDGILDFNGFNIFGCLWPPTEFNFYWNSAAGRAAGKPDTLIMSIPTNTPTTVIPRGSYESDRDLHCRKDFPPLPNSWGRCRGLATSC